MARVFIGDKPCVIIRITRMLPNLMRDYRTFEIQDVITKVYVILAIPSGQTAKTGVC